VSRRALSVVAELFFTASALVLLFLIYQLWFTTELAKAEHQELSMSFQELIESVAVSGDESGENPVQLVEVDDIRGVGLLYIPALKSEVWGLPIVSGIDDRALSQGAGHYPDSELPGETGNFAIAGHRATNGEPFAYFEKLMAGDLVFVQTTAGWFTYQLVEDRKIQETEVWVLEDDPIELGEQQLITLTTCDPRWNSTRRWAWWGVLVEFSPVRPAEVGA
jgi:sortase A